MRDEHCHIIWDVDDGSRSRDESLTMLEEAAKAGITEIVATPHFRWNDFDLDAVAIRFAELRAIASGLGITMMLGFEVFYETLLKYGLATAPGYAQLETNNLLLEFNTGHPMTDGWDKVFYELQTRYGLDITLAHPERYTTVLNDFDTVYQLKDMGVRLQVSAMDLYQKNSPFSRSPLKGMAKCARRIVDEGLCDAIVSDAHAPEHYQYFVRAMSQMEMG